MNDVSPKQLRSLLLSLALVASTGMNAGGQQASGDTTTGAEQAAPQTAVELQSLVAPIALYPDALVAQILGAATFPDQVAVADYWLQQHKDLTGSALMEAVNKESWEASVKALTQFPSVLDNMAKNLSWVSSLGEAYHNQAAQVMSAIQTLRAQAKAAGNLKSGSQIKVVQQSPQVIVIEPADPQVVYVPQYNPATIYGTAYVTPGYSAADVAAAGVIGFGAGIAVGALMSSSSCCGWGWSSWNCNWVGGAAYYGYHPYYGNTAWHGGYYGAGGTAYGPLGSAHYGAGYNPSTGTYARGASVNTPMEVSGSAKPTTRLPEPTAPRIKAPTAIQTGEVRQSREMGNPLTRSITRMHKVPPERCKRRMAGGRLRAAQPMANLRSAKRRMATSTLNTTAMRTGTLEAAGKRTQMAAGTTSTDLQAGERGLIVAVVGEACGPADSAEAGSEAETLVVEDFMAVVSGADAFDAYSGLQK